MNPAGALDALVAAVFAGLAATSVKSVLLAALAASGVMLWRVRTAGSQLTVWRWVLVAVLVMPALGLLLPALAVPVPSPAWWADNADASHSAVSASSVMPVSAVAGQAAAHDSATPGATGLTWLQLAAAIYAAGVLVLLLRALRGWVTARTLIRASVPVDDAPLLARAGCHAHRMQMRAAPRILSSAGINIPIAAGILTPTVVLPASWASWDAETLDAVLVHEVSHLSRGDLAVQAAALLYRAVWWPNPVAWWMSKHLATLADAASDEAVLSTRVTPARYAEILLSFFAAAGPASRAQSWHLAMARSTGAERRIDRVLSWKERRPMSVLSARYLTAACVAIVLAGVVSAARPELLAAPAPVVMPAPVSFTPAPRPLPGLSTVPAPLPAPMVAEKAVEPVAIPAPVVPEPQQQAAQPDDFAKGAYADDTPGLTLPRATVQAKPRYTADAMRAKLQGGLELEVVVGANGRVLRARIAGASGDLETYSRDSAVELPQRNLGLDEQALKAINEWRFAPGSLGGSAVPVLVKVVLEFRMY